MHSIDLKKTSDLKARSSKLLYGTTPHFEGEFFQTGSKESYFDFVKDLQRKISGSKSVTGARRGAKRNIRF